ncbi:hypothetical protein [Janthinobacterium sp.]|uniref:hypothetical protein n=1 Tax=Janthinobacterium sp. TaxID=1871054 RepID=UPI00293D61A8|nr:hypothetical protein [Janthinobacterium sp.]
MDATTIDWDTCVPVDMSTRADGTIIVSAPRRHLYRQTRPVKEPQTWEQYLDSLPDWEKTLMQKTHEPVSTRGLAEELRDASSHIMIVSDGGAKDDKGYFGWIIGTKHEVLWEGQGPARGNPMTAQRAEAYGKLSWICFLKHYVAFLDIQVRCEVSSFCDNMGVIQQTPFSTSNTAREAILPDYDILKEIKTQQENLRKLIPRLHQGNHVKGHQDKHKNFVELPRPAQLNILADNQATSELAIHAGPMPSLEFPSCSAYLLNAGQLRSSQEVTLLRWKWSDF